MRAGYKQTKLGEIPEEWEVEELGNLTRIYDGTHQTPKYVDNGIPFYSVEHVTANNFTYTKFISEAVFEKENKRVKLEKGDILMTRIGDVGTVRYIDWDVNASFYVSLALIKRNTQFIGQYLAQLIKGKDFQKELWKRIIHTAFPKKINLGEIGKCHVILPPLPEQRAIASILSTVDEKIDLVEAQIRETQALKKGLMQRLLTRGIGHTEFKDSPLGEIPVGWEVVKSAEVFELIHGYQFRDYDFTENGLPIVKIGQINKKGELDMSGCSYFSRDRAEEFADKRIFNGDVLMALTGATLGKSCWVSGVDHPVFQNYRVGKFEPHDEKILAKRYLYFLIGSPMVLNQIFSKINSGAQGNVGKSDFEKLKITLPPYEEQQKIANILSNVDEKLDLLQGKKLEYHALKKGLMQQLLTGKIRVKALLPKTETA